MVIENQVYVIEWRHKGKTVRYKDTFDGVVEARRVANGIVSGQKGRHVTIRRMVEILEHVEQVYDES